MTNFDPKGNFKDIDQWEAIALRKAASTGVAPKLIAGICIGGLGVSLNVAALGGVVGAWLIKSAWDGISEAGKRLRTVRDAGCNAFVLDEADFRIYLKQYGAEAVLAELRYAEEAGCELTNFAANWLSSHQKKALSPIQEVSAMAAPDSAGLGERIQNIASRISDTFQHRPDQPGRVDVYVPPNDQIDIVAQMSDRIQNILVVGQGGSGKGVLLSNALRAVKAKYPAKKIFLINGKDDPKEKDYFTDVVDVEKRLHCETAKPSTVAAWFEASVAEYDKFAASNNGALLVIDEGTIIGVKLGYAKSNDLNDKVIGIASGGGSMGKNVWLLVQTPFASGSGSTLTATSQMTCIVLVRGDAVGVLEQWKRSSLFRKFDATEVSELASKSECNRAIYWGGSASWYSLPKLTNYSAFNRDEGTFIKEMASTIGQIERNLQVSEQVTTIQDVEPNIDPELIDCILNKIIESDTISFDTLRRHTQRKLSQRTPDTTKVESIREALAYLINQEIIKGNEASGYSIT